MVSVKQPWLGATSLFHILLIALLINQASLALEPVWARTLDADRRLLVATNKVTEPVSNKENEMVATDDRAVAGAHWGGGWGNGGGYGNGWGHHGGGGGWGGGGGGYGHGGGGYGHGGGGYGHGGGGCCNDTDDERP